MAEKYENIVFYDIQKAPFEIFGLYEPLTRERYMRIPDELAKGISNDLYNLNYNTAGGRVRFATDSTRIVMSFDPVDNTWNTHYTALLGGAFDIYIDSPSEAKFVGVTNTYDLVCHRHLEAIYDLPAGMKEITVNFPLYGGVSNVMIGLDTDAKVREHKPYKHNVPVVYYGSSITQGACGSRAGVSYEAAISRMLDCNYINLGFSGSAKGEEELCRFMATLDMCAFVSDFDHNINDAKELEFKHYRLYEIIREKHPDIPYIMISRPNYDFFCKQDNDQRAAIISNYVKAFRNGDNNVWFVDGAAFFAGPSRSECTVEGIHPTDLGFNKMAIVIGDTIRNVMKW